MNLRVQLPQPSLILTSTEELHARIEQLMSRVQELEEALSVLQVRHTGNSDISLIVNDKYI